MPFDPTQATASAPDLAGLADQLLTAARRAGADQADAFAVTGAALSVDVRKGALEHAERADGTEIGLRVLIGGRQACVSASDTRPQTISDMAARAVAMAREAPVDDNLSLAAPADLARPQPGDPLELADTAAPPDPQALLDRALAAEAAALEVDGVSMMDSTGASYSWRRVYLATSNGFAGGYDRTGHNISAVAISGDGLGMERDWASEGRAFAADLPAPAEIGRLAGARAVARQGARKPPTGSFPVLYDQRVAAGLIGHLLAAVNGSAIARGASWLRNELGARVLPEAMTLREDPHLLRQTGSRLFDAEGLPTRARDIVADGVLTGWTLDLATGNKLGMPSTAGAVRSASSPPAPGVSNVTLSPGRVSPEALMRDMGRGLVVTSLLGSSVNPTTGDYSRGAAGFWIEDGQIAFAVNECTIAGNLRDMLMRMTAGDDLPDWRSHRVPSLLVEGMTLAGA